MLTSDWLWAVQIIDNNANVSALRCTCAPFLKHELIPRKTSHLLRLHTSFECMLFRFSTTMHSDCNCTERERNISRRFVKSTHSLQARSVIRQIRMTTIDILNFILDVRRDYRIALALAAFRQQYDAIEEPNNAYFTDDGDEPDDHGIGWPETTFEQVARGVAAKVREKTEQDTRLHLDGHASAFTLRSAREKHPLTLQTVATSCAFCFSFQCPNRIHCRHQR